LLGLSPKSSLQKDTKKQIAGRQKVKIERFISIAKESFARGRAGPKVTVHYMASIDFDDRFARVGPRLDALGLSLFVFHIFVSIYVLFGWVLSSGPALLFYLFLLPLVATQWRLNKGCCVINNIESWVRTGHWRDPASREEGTFLLMLSEWMFGVKPNPKDLDRLSYATVLLLWLLAFSHFSWLAVA